MAENRNASPQSVKDDTFDGDRLVGSGNGMSPGYARGCAGLSTCVLQASLGSGRLSARASRRPAEPARLALGRPSERGGEGADRRRELLRRRLQRAEVGEVLVDLEATLGSASAAETPSIAGPNGSALQATTTGHRTSPRCV